MKTFLCILAAALLGGCGKSATDLRIEKLETRNTALETNLAADHQRIKWLQQDGIETTSILTNLLALCHTNSNDIMSLAFALKAESDSSAAVFHYLTNQISRSAAPKYISRPAQPAQMPADVAAQIRAEAEREWPNDYSMQLNVIKWQTEDWHKLHP